MPEENEGDGPDNLWRMENGVNLIIEAKNNRTTETISRSDIEQLLHSIQWHKDKYGTEQEFIPIMLHRGKSLSIMLILRTVLELCTKYY